MSLLERVQSRLCREPGCRRAPVAPDQAFCAEHRLPWAPEWRRRAHETTRGLAKDLTGAGR